MTKLQLIKESQEMKNNRIFPLMGTIAIIAIVVTSIFAATSCTKENETKNLQEVLSEEKVSNDNSGLIPGIDIRFGWKWHRKKYNCRKGWGICDFKITIRPGAMEDYQNTTELYQTSDGNYIVFLEAPENAPFDDETRALYVDEDLTEIAPDGTLLTIYTGAYQFDESIGKHGGYAIPLMKE